MPPVRFRDKTTPTPLTGVGDTMTFTVPALAKHGDHLIAVIACSTLVDGLSEEPVNDPWEDVGGPTISAGGVRFMVVRHVFDVENDPPTLDMQLNDVPTFALGVLLAYEALVDGGIAEGATATSIVASTNFVCPSVTLGAYSDLYLGLVCVTSAGVAVTPPGGSTERHEQLSGGRTLEVFELLAEAAGATGTKTATTAGAQTGTAGSVALPAVPVVGAGKTFALNPIGTIGLPVVGV